jgi:DNA-binding NarL/FixJ family response regulator
MDPLTVLIANDHPVFRKRLRALLASIPDVDLAGEASSGADAIRLAEQLQPDVILMDLQMPGGGGLAGLALDKPPKGLTCNQWRKGHIM